MARRDDRATGRQGVRGRAGGRGHDQAVGGVGGEEGAVEVHPQAHGVAHRGLLEHRLVERDRRRPDRARPSARSTRTASSIRSSTSASPAEPAGERLLPVGGVDLGEVAELADVDPDDRHVVRGDEVDRAQHRAVAAEAQDHVGLEHRAARTPRPPSRPGAGRVLLGQDDPVAPGEQPGGDLAGQLDGLGPLAVDDHARRSLIGVGAARSRPRSPRPPASRARARRGAGPDVQEELDVPVGPPEWRHHQVHDGCSAACEGSDHAGRARRARGQDRSPRPGRGTPPPGRPRTAASRAPPDRRPRPPGRAGRRRRSAAR